MRGPGETAAGTLPGAREIPLAVLTDSFAATRQGTRRSSCTARAATARRSPPASCVEAGFADVSDLLGGYHAWEGAGLPTSTGERRARHRHDARQSVPAGARTLVDAGALLLDVREPEEWQAEHAPGAVLLPMGQVRQRQSELPRDRRIVVVCRSGGRSAAVTDSLRTWGFDAVNLAGGMCAWSAAGLPTETAADDGLVVHRVNPLNCETAIPALLGGVVMPNARFYVRNHFETPRSTRRTGGSTVGGLVERPLQLSLRRPAEHAVALAGGHARVRRQRPLDVRSAGRRRAVAPRCGQHGGVDRRASVGGARPRRSRDRAHATSCSAAPTAASSSRRVQPVPFERSLSLDDARSSEALLAYAMNGEPLPVQHGYPLRLIVPGWYAVTSVKWLTEIELIGAPFEAFFQTERYYFESQRDGATVAEPVRLQRVRSVITSPTAGAEVDAGRLDDPRRGVVGRGADRRRRRQRRRRPVAARAD